MQKIRERQYAIKESVNPVTTDSLIGKIPSSSSTYTLSETNKRPKLTLTPEQQQLINKNRQKALDRIKLRQDAVNGSLRDARTSSQYEPAVPNVVDNNPSTTPKAPSTYIRPSIHKKDYIEYDFSTMQDTFGGFVSNKTLDKDGNPIEMTLQDWKNQQLEKKNMTMRYDEDDLPPTDLRNAPTCSECGSYDLDKKMKEIFDCLVCKSCKEKHPEKYSLLTKTECKEDYFLTESELADLGLFKRIVKENPHSGTFSRMQLFLRYQIEDYAFKKWGSSENLDNEWLRREEMRKNRRERKFNNKLKEMRKKLRAEELTRNLRSRRDKKHIHEWSAPQKKKSIDDQGMEVPENSYVKRCIGCGMEVEEILM